ncbi:MAG: hypothetical protein M0Q24_01290 [Sulfurimonas sp.]|uniref:hypothetical protein n=1 Tax=Sulfurimonas sp. TaxID=2022749 RepID=UPI0025E08386|nr:hypothetical protein [Sulfurimonas sp.]MCK9490696.1 hypothetical protein [Sulfurimonas sp.]
MKSDVKKQLEGELDKYIKGKGDFTPYYPGMDILASELYKEQLKKASDLIKKQSESEMKSFELYLDTIIINMHTKVKKYKKSIYFDNENIKDIENQGYTIVFYIDEKNSKYALLGLLKSKALPQ